MSIFKESLLMVRIIWVSALIQFLVIVAISIIRTYYPAIEDGQLTKKEKKQRAIRYWLSLGMVIISILLVIDLILLPIGFYVDEIATKEFSQNNGDWGTFGDFIGGTLNPTISLLTLAFTVVIAFFLQSIEKKNRAYELKKNVQPELVTDLQRIIYCDSFEKHGVPYPDSFSYTNYQKVKQEVPKQYVAFPIPIYNIGYRPAKKVTFKFSMDFDSLITKFNELLKNNKFQGAIKVSPSPNKQLYGRLEFNLNYDIAPILLILQNTETISHILNVDVSANPYQLQLPSDFLELYKAYFFLYYWQTHKDFKPCDFPPITLSTEFYDIYETKYESTFIIMLEYMMGYEFTIHQLLVKKA